MINNTTYHIADNFTEEQIPADFTEATVHFRGTECRGLTFNKGTISLIYLEIRQCGRNDRQIFYL